MGQSYKMVFLDLDGTTLTSDKKITQRTKRIMETLDHAGIPVVITTGRSIYSVRNFFGYLNLISPVIVLNGAVVYENLHGTLQSYKQIDMNVLAELVDLFRNRKEIDNFLFEGIQDYYVYQSDQELRKSFVDIRKKRPLLIDSGHQLTEPITNLLVRPREKKDEIHEWLVKRVQGKMHFVNTEWHWIEGLNPGVHKGSAIAELAKAYRISLDEVVAIGDEWNDIEMLRTAGLGVAMGNASDEAKAVADYIAPTNDREGVAHVLEEVFADVLLEMDKKNLP